MNISKKSDIEIVELAKKNPNYFEEIVKRFEKPIYFFINRLFYFNKEDIEDILQEVFIKIYKNLNSFDKNMKFSSWVYQIARNHTIDVIRKNKRRPQIEKIDNKIASKIFKSSINIKQEIEGKNNIEEIKKIIKNIPFKYQEVLFLRFIEEKDYDEIMDILKKTKGTIASLINRGKKILINKIKKEGLNLNN